MDSQLAKKIIIDVQISGWSCLIPASGLLYLYQITRSLITPASCGAWPWSFCTLRGLRAGDRQAGKVAVPKLRFADELDRDVFRRLPAFNSAFVLLQPGA